MQSKKRIFKRGALLISAPDLKFLNEMMDKQHSERVVEVERIERQKCESALDSRGEKLYSKETIDARIEGMRTVWNRTEWTVTHVDGTNTFPMNVDDILNLPTDGRKAIESIQYAVKTGGFSWNVRVGYELGGKFQSEIECDWMLLAGIERDTEAFFSRIKSDYWWAYRVPGALQYFALWIVLSIALFPTLKLGGGHAEASTFILWMGGPPLVAGLIAGFRHWLFPDVVFNFGRQERQQKIRASLQKWFLRTVCLGAAVQVAAKFLWPMFWRVP